MLPSYASIPDGESEKQTMLNGYQAQQPTESNCQCWRQRWQEARRRGPSKSWLCLFVLFLFLLFSFGHDRLKTDGHYHHYDNNDYQTVSVATQGVSPTSSARNCHSDLDVPWDGKTVYEFGKNINALSLFEKVQSTINSKSGDIIVVVNEKLEKSKVTFDIKLDDDRFLDTVTIDEVYNEGGLELTVRRHGGSPGCVKVDAKVELTSSDALEALGISFIDNDITIKDNLQLKHFLSLHTISGRVDVEKSSTSDNIDLSVVSGDIKGRFDVDQVSFKASATSGNIDVIFDRISEVSTVSASVSSGNAKIQVPSDFESRVSLSVVSGNIDVKATDASKLHIKKSGRIIGRTISGYYGDHKDTPSEIKLNTVSGTAKLNFE